MTDKSKEHKVKSAVPKPESQEEPREEKKGRKLRAAVSIMIVLLVSAIAVQVFRNGGTGLDLLRRWIYYGSGERVDTYTYDAAGNNRFALIGDGMAVLSGTELRIIRGDGSVALSQAVNMQYPALMTAGEFAVAYDVGGTTLWLVNAQGETLLRLEQDAALPFIAASVNEAGYLAVTAEKNGCKGCVSVYGPDQTLMFAFNSVERFVIDARVSKDGKTVTAVTLGQEDGSFVSRMVVYDLTRTDPRAGWGVQDGVVLAMDELSGRTAVICDTKMAYGDADGTVYGEYDYGGNYLRGWSVGGGYVALQLNRYYAGSIGRIVTVDLNGNEKAAIDVNEEVIGISAAGNYIAVLYAGRLVIYTPDLQEYARMEDAHHAKDVLMCADGSALVLASEKATRFLP